MRHEWHDRNRTPFSREMKGKADLAGAINVLRSPMPFDSPAHKSLTALYVRLAHAKDKHEIKKIEKEFRTIQENLDKNTKSAA